MIRFLLLFILSTYSAFAAVSLQFTIPHEKVKQGNIIDAVVVLDSYSVHQIDIQTLKGITLASTVYLYEISPLVKNPDDKFEADVKLIFLKVPKTQPLIHKINDQEIALSWTPTEIELTEEVPEFLLGQFEVPARKQVMRWMIGLFILILVSLIGFRLQKKLKAKSAAANRKAEFKAMLTSGKDYGDVVRIWRQKALILAEFPQLNLAFKELEKVLFKYQFKLSQTENEKAEVVKAYQEFVSQIQGKANGI